MLASGAAPVLTVMNPPASMIRSSGAPIDDEVLDDREGGCPPRLDRDRVPVVELAHVELAGRGAALGAVGNAVDHEAAGSADPFPTIAVEGNRLLAVGIEVLIDVVEHLEERRIRADIVRLVGLEGPGLAALGLTPHPQSQVHYL